MDGWGVADLALVAVDQDWVMGLILQDQLHLGDLVQLVDAFERLVRLDWNAKMGDSIRLEVVDAFRGVGLVDHGTVSRQPLSYTIAKSERT